MELKNSKTNRLKPHFWLDVFFHLMCIFCLGFVGCQPESEIITVTAGQDNGTQSTESPDAKGKQISFKVVDSRIDARPGNSKLVLSFCKVLVQSRMREFYPVSGFQTPVSIPVSTTPNQLLHL